MTWLIERLTIWGESAKKKAELLKKLDAEAGELITVQNKKAFYAGAIVVIIIEVIVIAVM